MVERRVGEAVTAMGGDLLAGSPASAFRGAAIDSRRVRGGEMFFALAGERTDGHEHVGAALEGGASAVVISRPMEPASSGAWLKVSDTYAALHDLTRSVRRTVPERLAAVTGSVGKTTTKELLAAMLARRFRVARTPGNLNNLYGFPLSLLNIADDSQWMVAEMGMSTPGELREISLLGRPDAAVFTNVRPAHLENFDGLEGIAEAKAELLAGLADDGLVVANADDPWVMHIVRQHARPRSGLRTVLYGRGPEADVRGRDVEPLRDRTGSRFVLEAGGRAEPVELPLHGLYNVDNCLAAAACALALGVEIEEVARAVAGLRPAARRGEVHRLANGITLIDDAYNSNPHAAIQALESAARLPAGRRLAVLGDMLELGEAGPAYHREVGEKAARLGFARVVGVGALSRDTAESASRHGSEGVWLSDAASAATWLIEQARAEDLVLIKGSRGIGLEVAVEALRGRAEGGES